MTTQAFDLAVIGSGPAGQKAAIAAAKLGKSVAVIDTRKMLGGVTLHGGTLPSKTLREAILYFTGLRQRAFYGQEYRLKEHITVADLRSRVRTVIEREMAVVTDQLRRNGVALIQGTARFRDPHTLDVENGQGGAVVRAENVLIACGTRPAQSPAIPCDGRKIFVADQLGEIEQLPRRLIVVGAGVIGLEYASMMAALGIEVTLIEQRPTILDFVDQEIIEALCYHLRRLGMIFRLGETVESVCTNGQGVVVAELESGKKIQGDALLYTVGRQANGDRLGLEKAGLAADARGRIQVDECYRTAVPHIYAAGDVIGFPALASTSMEQGRIASCRMFDGPAGQSAAPLPYGIYTIPEISMVGKTERELTQAKTPYEVGLSKYEELAKGQMVGDQIGLLKLLFRPETRELLGVHVIGEGATEIVHIGQSVMALGGTIEYFRDTVFNYPTFAEAYKVAALDGLNKLQGV
jgi:NAD(P) transhydrogenase